MRYSSALLVSVSVSRRCYQNAGKLARRRCRDMMRRAPRPARLALGSGPQTSVVSSKRSRDARLIGGDRASHFRFGGMNVLRKSRQAFDGQVAIDLFAALQFAI